LRARQRGPLALPDLRVTPIRHASDERWYEVANERRLAVAAWTPQARWFKLGLVIVGRRSVAALLGVCLVGCVPGTGEDLLISNDDFLTEEDVQGLPAGDATGTDRSGFYRLGGFGIVDQYCARGNADEVFGGLGAGVEGFVFEHIDGQASMLGWDTIPVSLPVYAGGIDADGDFGLGAIDTVETVDGQEVGEVFYRVDGTISPAGKLESTWRQRVQYALGGDAVDCEAVAVVDATFEPGAEGDPCTLDADCPAVAPHCDGTSCYDGSVGDPCDDETACAGAFTCDGSPRTCR